MTDDTHYFLYSLFYSISHFLNAVKDPLNIFHDSLLHHSSQLEKYFLNGLIPDMQFLISEATPATAATESL